MAKSKKSKIEGLLNEGTLQLRIRKDDKILINGKNTGEEREVISGIEETLKIISDWLIAKHGKEGAESVSIVRVINTPLPQRD